ncbi:MAG TPA: hypothetical protein VLX60_03700 [Terriglobales bacterium]|nr:hypothetical protein [Terriglobales bacterium]
MYLLNHPVLIFIVSLIVLRLSAYFGTFLLHRREPLEADEREDLGVIVAAALTLLGLIIGFTFSMAVTRYDQRKNYEEEEANAIGTEYLRVNLLPAADASTLHQTLRAYLDQRIAFYEAHDDAKKVQIDAETSRLQSELWTVVENDARANPTPVMAAVVTGMNDVLNRQGYTQASWWNRIPAAAWGLMFAIAIACNALVGFTSRRTEAKSHRYFVLPFIVAISFFLIADIDSPRRGVIRVHPQNLESLAKSLQP